MIVEIILLFCSFIILVSTNPVTSAIPVQTYPLYQQSNYRIPLDALSRNINPCSLLNTVQSQPSLQGHTIPSNLNPILYDQFLSRPTVQALLDPSRQVYGLDGFQIPISPAVNPNVINNFILLPVEDTNINETNLAKKKLKTHNTKTKNKVTSKKRAQKLLINKQKIKGLVSKNKHVAKKITDIFLKELYSNDLNKNNTHIVCNDNRNSDTATKNINKIYTKDVNTNKRKGGNNNEYNIVDDVLTNKVYFGGNNRMSSTTQKPRICRRKAKIDECNNILAKDYIEGSQSNNGIQMIKSQQEKTTENTAVPLSGTNDLNSTIINDFLRIYLNLSHNMAKSISGGMNQYNDPQINSLFENYEQFYQSLLKSANYNIGDIERIIGRKKKTKNKRKPRNKKNNRTKNKNFAENNSYVSTIVFHNNDKYNLINKDDTVDNVSLYKLDKNEDELENMPVENTSAGTVMLSDNNHENQFNGDVFDKNDYSYDPNYYDWIDDYYPIFTDNAAYNANNKEVYIRNCNNRQKFYNRDEPTSTVSVSKQPTKSCRISERDFDESELNKNTYNNLEPGVNRNRNYVLAKEAVNFQNSHFLESPDFRTRKVDKKEILSNRKYQNYDELIDSFSRGDISDKASSFSNTKKTFNSGKHNVKKLQSKDKKNNVETVFAQSKVAKFGTLGSLEENNSNVITDTRQDFQNQGYQNGQTTYVVAKSLKDPEEVY